MPDLKLARCRSCGAGIFWTKTKSSGKLIPVDARPVQNGNIAIVDGMAVVFSGTLFEEKLPDGPRFQSHFASCPNASKHRKKKS